MQNIKFISKETEYKYNPKSQQHSFYQICHYKNPLSHKYGTRKILFNEQGTIIKTFEKEYSKDKITNFLETHRNNKYTIYPVSDISTIALPNASNIYAAKSELLR